MKSYIYIFLLLSSLTSCGMFKRDYPEIAHAITLKTAKELQQEKGMQLMATGGGMIDNVNHLTLRLAYLLPLKEKEARVLLIETLDQYLGNINSDEEVRPFLNNYPFKVKDISLSISFHHPDGSRIIPGKLDYVIISDGVLTYYTLDQQGRVSLKLLQETLKEARQKIQERDLKKIRLNL